MVLTAILVVVGMMFRDVLPFFVMATVFGAVVAYYFYRWLSQTPPESDNSSNDR